MSFSIGIYDLFAYTVPGFLYLYVIYAFLQTFGLFRPGLLSLPSFPDGFWLLVFVAVLVLAHLMGHLLDIFAHWFVFRLFKSYKFSDRILERTKRVHTDIDIQYQAKDWGLLFSMLRQRNLEFTRTIDSFEANSILLRNTSFGLFLLGALQIYSLFLSFNGLGIAIAIVCLLFSFIARRRSHMFHSWFLTDIFESSLRYGNSLQDVITYEQKGLYSVADVEKKPAKRRQRQT